MPTKLYNSQAEFMSLVRRYYGFGFFLLGFQVIWELLKAPMDETRAAFSVELDDDNDACSRH